MRALLVAAFCVIPGVMFAQECESVIALSKVRSVVVSDEATVERHAENFCKEYAKVSSGGSSTNIGVSYEFLAGTFGQTKASMQQVASRYCAADQSYQASRDTYKQYVESISPNAFSAYDQCKKMNESVRFDVDEASILPDEFTMSVSFASPQRGDTSATLAYSAPKGISCAWDGTEEKSVVIASGSTELLKCSRPDPSKKGYVTVVRKDGRNAITLPWPAYNADGIPVDQISTLASEVGVVTARTQQLEKAIEGLHSDNSNLKKELIAEISKRKFTWVRENENCPDGSQNLGVIGVIMHKDYVKNRLSSYGADFSDHFFWTHPILCGF